METRSIKVTYEKARGWYKSNNPILKELALQAFTQKELEIPTFEEISEFVGEFQLSREEAILRTLAEYYRKLTDKFYPDQEKYFIGKNSYNEEWTIIKHSSVLYPGLGYYLREKDAKEALNIFLEEIRN